jgi:tryptophanyl-tRNA synthetase
LNDNKAFNATVSLLLIDFFRATHVPVGEDQLQHLELTRDVATLFNKTFKTRLFPLPEAIVRKCAKKNLGWEIS